MRLTLSRHRTSIMEILRSIIGIAVFIGIAWLLSEHRSKVSWKLIFTALGLQILLAVLVMKVGFISDALSALSGFFVAMIDFANRGAAEVFGALTSDAFTYNTVIGFRVLPAIIFFAALAALLYYWGVLQKLVYALAWVMSKTMKLSGAESLAAAANVFIGQTEAPLLVKPYLEKMTRSEIMALMTGGFATIAGTVLAAFILFLGGDDPEQKALYGKHLITASILSAPAALLFAKLMVPETQDVNQELQITDEEMGSNAFDAISRGTGEGLRLAFNVGAMLIVFIAFVAMVNYMLGDMFGNWTGLNGWVASVTDGRFEAFSLEFIFGIVFAPVAWLIGVSNAELMAAGQLLGEKLVINEFFAFIHLGELKAEGVLSDERSIILLTYALCGFSNFPSMGIQIGGISAIAPGQRSTICALAIKALTAGSFACFVTACVAGMFI